MPIWLFWAIFSTLIFVSGYTLYDYFLAAGSDKREEKRKRKIVDQEVSVRQEKIARLEGRPLEVAG